MSDTTDTPITDEAWGKPYTRQDQRLHTMRRTCCDLERQLAEARMAFAIATDELVVEQSAHRRTREQIDRLAEALETAMARAYAAGYQQGHEDTVESQFTIVHHSEAKDYFTDNVRQMVIDGSQPEVTEALVTLERKEAE